MAATAPAFGLIGTLVDLVITLENLGTNPEAIGPALAIALRTTLYGVLLARLVFLQAASKLGQREGIIRFCNNLVSEGFDMLAEHKSPRYIQDKMNSFLDPAIRYHLDKGGRGAQQGGGGRQQPRRRRGRNKALERRPWPSRPLSRTPKGRRKTG